MHNTVIGKYTRGDEQYAAAIIDEFRFWEKQLGAEAGFPPIREIREFREILKTFSSQGNQGKTGGFQPKSGKKISNQGTFFKTIFKPFNLM